MQALTPKAMKDIDMKAEQKTTSAKSATAAVRKASAIATVEQALQTMSVWCVAAICEDELTSANGSTLRVTAWANCLTQPLAAQSSHVLAEVAHG